MKKTLLIVFACIGAFLLCSCSNTEYKQGVKSYNNQDYVTALQHFKTFRDGTSDEGETASANGYIYACSYHILQNHLKEAGKQKIELEKDNGVSGITGEYTIIMDDFDTSLYIGIEGTTISTSSEVKALFNNYFILLPEPNEESPIVPFEIEWVYGQSDVLKGYSPLTKAEGKVVPNAWFTLSDGSSAGKVKIAYNLDVIDFTGSESTVKYNPTSMHSRLFAYLNSAIQLSGVDLTYSDFGFTDLQLAIDNYY